MSLRSAASRPTASPTPLSISRTSTRFSGRLLSSRRRFGAAAAPGRSARMENPPCVIAVRPWKKGENTVCADSAAVLEGEYRARRVSLTRLLARLGQQPQALQRAAQETGDLHL